MTHIHDTVKLVTDYLARSGWIVGLRNVRFLAAGEYNQNFLVESEAEKLVFRINHGSQLDLADQIEYEFNVLRAVADSGVTPKPIEYDTDPGKGLGNGVLLMEYLPGRALEYRDEYLRAADVFAKIHRLAPTSPLLRQDQPMLDIAEESSRLLTRFEDHPLTTHRRKLLTYRDHIIRQAEENRELFETDGSCIVNTEVNSSNFLVHREDTYLVDWEKAVVSSRYQDLGHFLVPTTTLWKGDYVFSDEERRAFLSRYRDAAAVDIPLSDLDRGAKLLENTIILRGLSWCFMAYYEYTQTDRELQSNHTFGTITRYMNELDWFLETGYGR
jgi:aminoglycoside phosphotransferase (APT) family kinase protein